MGRRRVRRPGGRGLPCATAFAYDLWSQIWGGCHARVHGGGCRHLKLISLARFSSTEGRGPISSHAGVLRARQGRAASDRVATALMGGGAARAFPARPPSGLRGTEGASLVRMRHQGNLRLWRNWVEAGDSPRATMQGWRLKSSEGSCAQARVELARSIDSSSAARGLTRPTARELRAASLVDRIRPREKATPYYMPGRPPSSGQDRPQHARSEWIRVIIRA